MQNIYLYILLLVVNPLLTHIFLTDGAICSPIVKISFLK